MQGTESDIQRDWEQWDLVLTGHHMAARQPLLGSVTKDGFGLCCSVNMFPNGAGSCTSLLAMAAVPCSKSLVFLCSRWRKTPSADSCKAIQWDTTTRCRKDGELELHGHRIRKWGCIIGSRRNPWAGGGLVSRGEGGALSRD